MRAIFYWSLGTGSRKNSCILLGRNKYVAGRITLERAHSCLGY
uniref:Uncharacterized protein n=1 Tax=Picea sitchensis TaxID=3332 RepID=D5ABZ1_PICSI|nr:unknown [Picea sitchensis]